MAKFERLRNSWFLVIDKITKDWGKPTYNVIVNDTDKNDPFDGVTFTEDAWLDLGQYFQSQKSGIIWRPFSDQEIERAWKPRFSGMNPEYKKFARMAWEAAFEYVNDQIYKNLTQEDIK